MPIIIDAWFKRALRDAWLKRALRDAWFDRVLAGHPRLRRWVWFVAIYIASVVVFAVVAFTLEALVPR
ncbi:MAG: hypothetical protein ACYCZB_14925 [Acidiphilium sp.]